MPDTVLILGRAAASAPQQVAALQRQAGRCWRGARAPTTQPHPRVRWIDAPLHDAEALSGRRRKPGGTR